MGKSTVLNFVEHYLGRPPDGNTHPIVVRFNPWWFTGREDLILQFFDSTAQGHPGFVFREKTSPHIQGYPQGTL
ncbi:MAG: hypothetical protein JW941_03545 [Candidatus Coatesbacteria bacterium]|nr:hypothetical protein [Candidatus Coatesbacteria bacterium]